jgi:pimeloyl-ACP methyl ester carboxylesterase
MHTAYFNYQGQAIRFRTLGTGSPVLLIHGFGEDGAIFEPLGEFLGTQHAVCIPDLPGSGHSGTASDRSIEGLATACLALMDQQAPNKPFVVIGHSMGGYISLALAEQAPERIAGLVLFHSSAYADSDEKKAARAKSIAFIQSHGGEAFLTTMIPGLFAPAFQQAHPAVVAHQTKLSFTLPDASLIQYYEAMMARPDRTHVLQQAEFPVLFLIGGQDQAVPAATVVEQSALPKRASVCVMDEVGHMGMLESPEACFTAIEDFLMNCNLISR